MSFIDKLESRVGLEISNVTVWILGMQILGYFVSYGNPVWRDMFVLRGNSVLDGEWWRMITVLFTPVSESPIFAAFAWYLYYLMGSGLERYWGSFKYLVYLGIAYICSLISAFIIPGTDIGNAYLYTTTFLAFAYLYPDFRLLIFFILPVKIRWLAAIMWLGLGSSMFFGSPATRIMTIVTVGNYVLFFGRDIFMKMGGVSRLVNKQIEEKHASHLSCSECGTRDAIFYSCHDCQPLKYFCPDHIRNHIHKRSIH